MTKRLYRSMKERRIAGVCGGISEYFDIDPVFVRVIFVVMLFCGLGLLAYIVLWIVMPLKQEGNDNITQPPVQGA